MDHSDLHVLDLGKFLNYFGHITFVEINYKIISMVILPLLLIQEGQLSVTD